MKQFEKRIDDKGNPYLATPLSGYLLTRLPLLNKSTGFSREERRELGLEGLVPPHSSTIEQQVQRTYANYSGFTTALDKHVYLRVLQDRNEVLFYALLEQHLEEMLPIIYTPTVAEAVQKFSLIYRFPRGLVVSTENIDRIDEVLATAPLPDVRLVVATDSEGILGIGDQGFGGMAICIGKLSLYTAAAGIDPATTLPIELDVGTNRADLLDDPLYLGVRHERLVGPAYEDFIERFVVAFKKRFPDALLQWEDFSKQKAVDVMNRYRDVLPSFNDDIQGTGAVVLAGLLAAARKTRRPMTDETYVVHGAGAGGMGVGRQIVVGLQRQGLSRAEAVARVLMIDSAGLVVADRPGLESYKRELAQDPSRTAGWQVAGAVPSLLETVTNAKATGIIGLSGQAGAFDEAVVKAVLANSPAPIVFPLSNPTVNSEAVPEDVYAWTGGRAIVATGSPFPNVQHEGRSFVVGQGNNAFVFPGVGLGALVTRATKVTDNMLTAAAEALSEYTDPMRLMEGAVYPSVSALGRASRHVAVAVANQAMADGVARREVKDTQEAVSAGIWEPRYLPIRRA
ncbi:MAG TPA: NAD-dependent malic enzyme [Trueperaceae bacterium]|nr:NAD-dependent malic enzyme [Trueperaceae bacterium]